MSWAADQLNFGFYRWRAGWAGPFVFGDGRVVPAGTGLNAGTAGVQNLFSQVMSVEAWRERMAPGGFDATYREMFGDPFLTAIEPVVPDAPESQVLQLPFEPGKVWSFNGGPHSAWGDGSGWAALDFAPSGYALGCVWSDEWVTAVGDGPVGPQSKPNPGPRESAASSPPPTRWEDATQAAGAGESGTYLLARTAGGLGLVISLIILAYFAVRRYGPKYLRRQGAQGALKVIETLPIGEKRSIALIQVEDKRLLIGNTQQQITLLAQLPMMPEAVLEPAGEPLPRSTPGTVSSFRKLYEVEKGSPPLPQAKAIPQDLREKMRQLREALEK